MIGFVAALALGLALLTSQQLPAWQSEAALWTQAATVSPRSPRPQINLAAVRIREGDTAGAMRALDAAAALADQRADDQRVARDLIAANWAVLRIREGRFAEARALVVDAPAGTARWVVCQRAPGVCADTP